MMGKMVVYPRERFVVRCFDYQLQRDNINVMRWGRVVGAMKDFQQCHITILGEGPRKEREGWVIKQIQQISGAAGWLAMVEIAWGSCYVSSHTNLSSGVV